MNLVHAGFVVLAYDPIGRLTTHASDLGSFTLSYLGQTGQIANRALVSKWTNIPSVSRGRQLRPECALSNHEYRTSTDTP